jgi:hypothetical protein
MMRLFRILTVVLVGIGALSATVAQASAPVKDPPNIGTFDIPLPSSICGFDITVHFTAKEHFRTFSNGVTAGEGQLKGTITGNGNTININFSGPGRTTQSSTDATTLYLRGEGTNLVFFFPGELGPDSPGALYLVHGLFTETLNLLTGPVPGSFTTTGSVEDLCAALA